ncbi:Alpha/Beta Hydrolase Domain-Containing Protein [Acetobacter pomorum DM001]|uniref:Alpha/Beta Hydrolase Domain-Containing Protein n=1 Tax=Acetobacter pomorum DM001 TaxID=945681 RepID=F1YWK8_9PROT|nr:Alpha/Beta Hydrolase Domain-Containing Protein [Acetobacter pomorum DM001]
MTMQKIAGNQVAMSDFSDVPQNSVPARPNLPSRLLLRCITWQEQLKREYAGKDAPEADRPHNVAQEMAAFLVRLRKAMDTPSFPLRLSSVPMRRVVTLSIPGAAAPMRARLFIPYGRVRGALLYLHGGGFVHCGLNSHYGICCRLARASGAAVLLPDYRLAPEHPFPAAIDDSQAALQWLAGASARYWGVKLPLRGIVRVEIWLLFWHRTGARGWGPNLLYSCCIIHPYTERSFFHLTALTRKDIFSPAGPCSGMEISIFKRKKTGCIHVLRRA